jgi:hypothetical protein
VKTPEMLPYRANLSPLGRQSILRKEPASNLIRFSAENASK